MGPPEVSPRSMSGFEWSERRRPLDRALPGDMWCVRDAFCELFRWSPGSDDWSSFIEGPEDSDCLRLCNYLGLRVFDPMWPEHVTELGQYLDYPGVTFYVLERLQAMHCLFQPHIGSLRSLPVQYRLVARRPELVRIVVDPRQHNGTAAPISLSGLR